MITQANKMRETNLTVLLNSSNLLLNSPNLVLNAANLVLNSVLNAANLVLNSPILVLKSPSWVLMMPSNDLLTNVAEDSILAVIPLIDSQIFTVELSMLFEHIVMSDLTLLAYSWSNFIFLFFK